MDPVKAVEMVDENTICVAVILGSTLTGEFEDVKLLNKLLLDKNKRTGQSTIDIYASLWIFQNIQLRRFCATRGFCSREFLFAQVRRILCVFLPLLQEIKIKENLSNFFFFFVFSIKKMCRIKQPNEQKIKITFPLYVRILLSHKCTP